MNEIDGERAVRKVWVVRVPPYVAKQWREAIAVSAEGLVDEHTEPATLGHLTLEEGNPTTLRVKGPDGGEQLLYMNPSRDTVDTTIISYDPADGSMADPRVEGVAFKRFDAAPVKLSEVGRVPVGLTAEQRRPTLGTQVDAGYLAKTKQRLAAAAKPQQKRKIAVLEDDKEINQLAGGTKDAPLYVKNRQAKKAAASRTTTSRRERLSKDELESMLFNLFEGQQYWHFTQIQKTLDQPVATIKEVLVQIADQIKRGPHKDLWELKAAYKKTGAGQQQAAAGTAG